MENRIIYKCVFSVNRVISGLILLILHQVTAEYNDGNSPLFFKNYDDYFGTLHTVVYVPNTLSLIIGVGENCEPITFSLQDYLDGTIALPNVIKGTINQTHS